MSLGQMAVLRVYAQAKLSASPVVLGLVFSFIVCLEPFSVLTGNFQVGFAVVGGASIATDVVCVRCAVDGALVVLAVFRSDLFVPPCSFMKTSKRGAVDAVGARGNCLASLMHNVIDLVAPFADVSFSFGFVIIFHGW